MPFSFSFRFVVPGLSNPFASQSVFTSNPSPKARLEPKPEPVDGDSSWVVPAPAYPHHHLSPTPSSSRASSSPAPSSRKRGWVPSTSEPSQATIMTAATSGFLDTPSKYRDLVDSQDSSDEVVVDLPPSKRRKGITGSVESVLSTAVSAALIGAAVGVTVYRMWRDRGKEGPTLTSMEQSPPPPYQEEWVEARPRPQPSQSSPISPISPTHQAPPVQKARSTGTPGRRPVTVRHRRTQTRARLPRSGREFTSNTGPPQPEFNFNGPGDDDADPKDEMDWIGDKLARLIEEGKRALGTEVVVMSDAQEDEVDDGSGNWVEENEGPSTSHKRSRTTPRSIVPSPSSRKFDFSSPSIPIPRHGKGRSDGHFDVQGTSSSLPVTSLHSRHTSDVSPGSFSSSTRDPENDWQSAHVREAMERARSSYRQKRGLGLDLGQ